MKLRQWISIILVILMVLGMAACGESNPPANGQPTSESTAASPEQSASQTPTATATSDTPSSSSSASPEQSTTAPTESVQPSTEPSATQEPQTSQPASESPSATASATPNQTPSSTPASNVYPENGLSKTDKVNLKMAFFEGGVGKAWMEYAIKTFTQKFPNVTIEMTSSPTIDKIIQTKISAANDEDMFDMFSTTRLTWEELVDAGKLVVLDDLWDRSPYDTSGKKLKNLIFDYSYRYQRCRRLGKSYAIDYSINVMGLFYDKNFFKKNGWNEQPKTYDEFIKLCDTIKAKNIYPITFYKGYQWGLFRPKIFELALESGNTAFDNNFRNYIGPQYTAPESLTMWNRMYDMGKKKYIEPGSGTVTHIISQMQVLQHKSAMVASGSWIQNEMKDKTPAGFEWGYMVMPFVSKPDSKLCVQQVAEDSLFVWAGKPELNIKWSKEFVLWMQNLDIQTEMAKAGMMSIRKDFASNPDRVGNVQGVCRTILDRLATGKLVTVDIATRDVTLKDPEGLSDMAYGMAEDIRIAVALGKKDPGPTLQQCEEMLQKAMTTGAK